MSKSFYILSTFGELVDIAIHLKEVEKCDVVLGITDMDYQKVGQGIVKRDNNWFKYLGQNYVFIIDGCEHGELQLYLRSQGEAVFGNGGPASEKLEEDRQMGQKLFKLAGFPQPESQNFTEISQAIQFVKENRDRRFVLKQNGSAPKSLSYVGKFEDSSDMLFHLQELQNKWNEAEFGKFNGDIMEFVDG